MSTILDRINNELVEITDQLNELATDAFAERWALRGRQDELRKEAHMFREDTDDSRSTAQLELELNARRDQLNNIVDLGVNSFSQSAAGGDGGARIFVAEAANQRIYEAQGADTVRARIAKIEAVLAQRQIVSVA